MRALTRPNGTYSINQASPQANGLIGWFPLGGSSRGNTRVRNVVLEQDYAVSNANPVWRPDASLGMVPYWAASRYRPQLAGSVGDQFSVAMIFKRTDTGSGRWVWGTGDQTLNNCQVHIGTNSTTTVNFNFWNNDLSVTVPSILNSWQWMVAVYDKSLPSNNQKIYLQGVLVGQRTNTTGFLGTQQHYLGWRQGFNESFYGEVADVRVYNRALSADEAWQMWAPETRWELYRQERRIWVASPGGTPPAGRRRSWAAIIGG